MRFDEAPDGEDVGLPSFNKLQDTLQKKQTVPSRKRSDRLTEFRQAQRPFLICGFIVMLIPFLVVFGLDWANSRMDDNKVIPDRFFVFRYTALFLSLLILFHLIAWIAKRWMTISLVRAIDYLYLSAAGIALLMTILRQNLEHSQYVDLWSRPVTDWLIAALALRMTRTTIEVFGWHRR